MYFMEIHIDFMEVHINFMDPTENMDDGFSPSGGPDLHTYIGRLVDTTIFLFHKQQPWKPGGGDEIYAAMDICSNLGGRCVLGWLTMFMAVIFCPGLGQGCNEGVTAGFQQRIMATSRNAFDLDQKVVIIAKIMAVIGCNRGWQECIGVAGEIGGD
ncbi:hypothetical protein Vretifemale_11098 [Volvox reticuliferus]|uniref:Uncharacterized protein n=1 Tax=Volvox reticuliferus TaxID=1737510 RepID=A0A8J4CFW9_9CHLO|nr:hypothetical protein Vretifemale_11098 [Volvox reticuliferus]